MILYFSNYRLNACRGQLAVQVRASDHWPQEQTSAWPESPNSSTLEQLPNHLPSEDRMALPDLSSGTLYIEGKWRHPAFGQTFAVTNPATSQELGQVSAAGTEDVREAVAAAESAFPAWAARTAYERAGYLYAAHRLMLERADDLARLITMEQGKPLRTARIEVQYAADFLIWFAEEAKRVYGRMIPSSRADQRFMVLRQPVGVVGAVTPWNYPISMLTRKIGPALAAGCTVVLKPAQQTPLCAVEVFRILHEVGVPAGVVNLVTASRARTVGDEFLANPAVRKLTFTVFPDADPAHAARGASLVKFLNTGQACICPNRIFVHRSIADKFLEVLRDRVGRLKAGNGLAEGVTIGPLIDEGALAKMDEHVG